MTKANKNDQPGKGCPGIKRLNELVILMSVVLSFGITVSRAVAGEVPATKVTQEDKTGTNPTGFANKFTPFYTYTELENGLEVQQLMLSGSIAFNKDVQMTYDLPMGEEIDFSGLPAPANTTPTANGMGDLKLRFMVKPPSMQFKDSSHIFGMETTFPTATDPALGGDVTIMSPMYVYVKDVKITGPGFIALANFYDFDLFKSAGEKSVSRYRGRYFAMIPLAKPGPNLLDGLYLLPEMQAVYDFERDDNEFSLWFAPELGKLLGKTLVTYIKPGWGIVKDDPTDRDFTFELGFRYFM
jgi:hypothetical protein